MNSRYFFKPELVCSSGITVAISSAGENETVVDSTRNTPTSSSRISPSSFMIRMAMKISRARWFSFLRRVFHYQNGLRSEFGTNPFNSVTWMITELIVLVIQISMIGYTLAISKKERPVWPMRIWVSGYGFGCVLGLLQLCFKYRVCVLSRGDASSLPDIERPSNHDDSSRVLQRMNKYRSFLELFFAIWFVVGNIWMFDSRMISLRHAPKLYILCISLLSWNAISYSFPFILFVLLCCIVPLVSSLLGYNISTGSMDRGALDEQISKLASWRYKEINNNSCSEMEDSAAMNDENPECCICLAKYKDNEEIRQLPCSHVFHLKCVDQWLRIISCCPLCKKQLQR